METRHPAEGLLGSKFLVICNSYGGLKSQDVEILWEIIALFEKTTPYTEIFTIMFRKFS